MEPKAGVTKQDIREQIWDYMESQNLADFPRPVHHRIPNFKGSLVACQNIRELEVFSRTREVKVDPDKPLEGVRLLALQSHKTLLVPTPRLRTGLFNKIVPPPGARKDVLRKCATSQGVRDYSVPIGLDAKVLVDLIVVGSVAVSEKGWRIGKGEGFADLEYAMMVSMGAVRDETPVVTVVHDCQVVDISEGLVEDHDLTVDYVLTPTRVIKTGCQRPKPKGITWCKIRPEVLQRIPVLRSLRWREQQAGKDVTLWGQQQWHEASPDATQRPRDVPQDVPQPTKGPVPTAHSCQHGGQLLATVCVGGLPAGTHVGELKRVLREHQATPLRLTWQGPRRPALLGYRDAAEAERVVTCLQGLHLGTSTLQVELEGSGGTERTGRARWGDSEGRQSQVGRQRGRAELGGGTGRASRARRGDKEGQQSQVGGQ